MNAHVITLLCLLAAAVFYAIGFGFGVQLAFVVGGLSELIFWVRVSGSVTRPNPEKSISNN